MNHVIAIDRTIFDAALDAASALSLGIRPTGLATVPDAGVLGRAEALWDRLIDVLNRAYLLGREQANAAVESALKEIDLVLAAADRKAKEIQDLLTRRLREFVRQLLQGAISLVPAKVQTEGRELSLLSMKYHQKLSFSGSLKTNLLDAVELVSAGELQIEFQYGVTGATVQ